MSAQTSNDSGSLLTTKCAICKMSFGTRRVLSPPSQRHSKRESPSRRLRGLINTLWIFPDSSSIHQTPLLQELQNPSASGCMERVSGGSKELHKNRACLCTGLCERINTPSFFALITIPSLSFSLSKLHGHSQMKCVSAFSKITSSVSTCADRMHLFKTQARRLHVLFWSISKSFRQTESCLWLAVGEVYCSNLQVCYALFENNYEEAYD
jgi:hypothetical protein